MKQRFKPFVALLLIMATLFSAVALTGGAEELTDEQIIWYYLKDQGLTDCGVAGLMGNLFAESGLRPNNLQDSYERKLGYTDASYTAAVDSGSYSSNSFIHDSAGFGLAQWTYWSRKEGLYNYAISKGASIGDLEMQLGYLVKELKWDFASVWSVLKTADTVRAASNAVLLGFEQPADQSTAVQNERTDYGFTYYNKYQGTTRPESSSEDSGEDSSAPTYILGDVNGDGFISSSDCIAIQAALNGVLPLTPIQKAAADTVADGNVTASDYVCLMMYLTHDIPFN